MKPYWETTAKDYHEFDIKLEVLNECGLSVGCEEVGFHDGSYRAVFWFTTCEKPVEFIRQKQKEYEND